MIYMGFDMHRHDFDDYKNFNKIMIHENGSFLYLKRDETNIKNSLKRCQSGKDDGDSAVYLTLYEYNRSSWYNPFLLLVSAGTLYNCDKSDVYVILTM